MSDNQQPWTHALAARPGTIRKVFDALELTRRGLPPLLAARRAGVSIESFQRLVAAIGDMDPAPSRERRVIDRYARVWLRLRYADTPIPAVVTRETLDWIDHPPHGTSAGACPRSTWIVRDLITGATWPLADVVGYRFEPDDGLGTSERAD